MFVEFHSKSSVLLPNFTVPLVLHAQLCKFEIFSILTTCERSDVRFTNVGQNFAQALTRRLF